MRRPALSLIRPRTGGVAAKHSTARASESCANTAIVNIDNSDRNKSPLDRQDDYYFDTFMFVFFERTKL